ncbi:hypothetical protein WH47_10395 [Habropoda laboriosa]|uniref:Uncharacterized protein n=1 Tax=Habropoda laboriosa TaxID=597456 RepID=A0A0L7R9S3_9HYME|nr:hypothetical protein WH47_10395 [Habropoda laboriosa]
MQFVINNFKAARSTECGLSYNCILRPAPMTFPRPTDSLKRIEMHVQIVLIDCTVYYVYIDSNVC